VSQSVETASQASTLPKSKRQCVPTVLLDTLLASVQRSAHSARQASTLPATALILFSCVWIVPRTPTLGQCVLLQLGPRTRACVSHAQPANIHRKVQSPPVLASLVDFTPTVLLDATWWKCLNVMIFMSYYSFVNFTSLAPYNGTQLALFENGFWVDEQNSHFVKRSNVLTVRTFQCKECHRGTFSTSGNASACTSCAMGQYQNELGTTICQHCPSDSWTFLPPGLQRL